MNDFTLHLGQGVAFLADQAWAIACALLGLAAFAGAWAWWEGRRPRTDLAWQGADAPSRQPWGEGALLVCLLGLLWFGLRPAPWAGHAGDFLALLALAAPLPACLALGGQAWRALSEGPLWRSGVLRARLQVWGPLAQLRASWSGPGHLRVPAWPEDPEANCLLLPGPPQVGQQAALEARFAKAMSGAKGACGPALAWDGAEDGDSAAWVAAGYRLTPWVLMQGPSQVDPALAQGPEGWSLRPLQGEVDWALATQMALRARHDGGEALAWQALRVRQLQAFRKAVAEGRAQWWGAYEGDRLMAHVGAFAVGPGLEASAGPWVLQEPCLAWRAWVPQVGASFLSMALAKLQEGAARPRPVLLLLPEGGDWHQAARQAAFEEGPRARSLWRPVAEGC